MLDRNVVLVLRTRQERTERRLRHKKEANPPPMEPPALLLNNNHLYLDLNMNFSENCKQEAARAARKSSLSSHSSALRFLRYVRASFAKKKSVSKETRGGRKPSQIIRSRPIEPDASSSKVSTSGWEAKQ
ncbi:hypothetical protein X777_01682 [Ooceraea biroi]|uniref:Uncharacterized protein n=1 Tax=Ooceraea biroi TaxID=2015173 RepID=A0A026WN58_OOCBI|nr:hypothetical protein X777_01682 [Ooceraea biroi]